MDGQPVPGQEPDLEELKGRILKFCNPKQIVLFGSRARGAAPTDSDVDLLVVWDEKAHLSRSARYMQLTRAIGQVPYGLDLLVYSSEELALALAEPHSFASKAMKGARILYG